jgi:hypothetical protein
MYSTQATYYTSGQPVPSYYGSFQPYVYNPNNYLRFSAPQTVVLRNYTGRHLCAKFGQLFSDYNPLDTSYFTILHLGNGIVELRAQDGMLVALSPTGQTYLTPNHLDYDTRFHMEWFNGQVAFRMLGYNIFLCIDPMTGMVRGSPVLTQDCLFTESYF